MGFLDDLDLPYEVRNVTANPQYARQLEEKTGQCKSPTVEIDDTTLADANVKDVAAALEKRGIHI